MHAAERIATDLRGRIERGELAPGDRVPSARQIVRQWGVAIATATKAHAALRAAGLVEAVPGVGTVVRRPAARAAEPAPPRLRPDRITAVAVAVADAEGLDGVSMRRLAAELGVGPMSLYRHVRDKDDLVLRMLDAVLREWRPPAADGASWRECVEAEGRGLWSLCRRHPWLAPTLSMTRPQAVAGGLVHTEWMLDVLSRLGLDPQTTLDVHLTLVNYVRGVAINLESEQAAVAATGLDADAWALTTLPVLREITAGGGFPQFERIVADGYDFSLDRLFERGLRLLLDGLERELRPPPGAAPPSG